jgi:hypothetical protein
MCVMTNRQWQVTIALLALVLTSACGKSPTGPDPNPGPVVGTSVLTIKVKSTTGSAATGTVTLFGPAPSTTAVTVAIANEMAVFSGLAAGDYRYNVAPSSFGDATKENNAVSVSQPSVAMEVVLDKKWDIRFIDVSAAGKLLSQNDVVNWPTTLRFHYHIMNPEATARAWVSIQAEIGFDTGIGDGFSPVVGPGFQDVTMEIANFRPCNQKTGRCFATSFRFSGLTGPPDHPTVIQRDTDFLLNYQQ